MTVQINNTYSVTAMFNSKNNAVETRTGVLWLIEGDWLCFRGQNGVSFQVHGKEDIIKIIQI